MNTAKDDNKPENIKTELLKVLFVKYVNEYFNASACASIPLHFVVCTPNTADAPSFTRTSLANTTPCL